MLPSKRFFIHAGLILLVGVVWFVVAEQRRSRLEFDGELLAFDEQNIASEQLTDEEANALIDELLGSISREISLNERENQPVPLLSEAAKQEETVLITGDELTLLYTPTEADVREYGILVSQVIKTAFEGRVEDEIQTFYRMINEPDPTLAGELIRRERAYTGAALTLRDIPTPTSAAFVHIQIANIFLDLGEALAQMSQGFNGIEDAISAGRFFEVRMSSLNQEFQNLNNYFTSRGIIFKETEQTAVTIFETN